MGNLEFTKTGGYGVKVATFESIAKTIAAHFNSKIELYHKSESGSEYYFLTDLKKEDSSYVQLRVSDHSIMSRGMTACTGGADHEIFNQIEDDEEGEELINECIEEIELMHFC